MSELTPEKLGEMVASWYQRQIDAGAISIAIRSNRTSGGENWYVDASGPHCEENITEVLSITAEHVEVRDEAD